MPIAFSYQRFSTPEQQHGDSLRRQQQQAEAYCQREGLHLSADTFQDLGVSAYTGANLGSDSQLRAFLNAVGTTRVPRGSYLLVENFDRVSRLNPVDAWPIFQDILRAGIVLVTLNDGRKFTEESARADFSGLMMSLMQMHLAHDESRKKSERLSAVYQQKRATSDNRIRLPFWIKRSNGQSLTLDPQWAPVVRRMFDLAATDGLAGRAIANRLNREGAPRLGGKPWSPSTINRILCSRSVLGEYQPYTAAKGRARSPIGEPKLGFYPTLVDEATFLRINSARHTTGPRLLERGPRNLFSSLLFCKCGAAMHVKAGSTRDPKDRLICSSRCGEPSILYEPFEFLSVTGLSEVLEERIDKMENSGKLTSGDLELKRADLQARIDALVDQLEGPNRSPAVMKRISEHEAELERLSRIAANQTIQQDDELGGYATMRKLVGSDYLFQADDPQFRRELSAAFGRWINRADLIVQDGHRAFLWHLNARYWMAIPNRSETDLARILPAELH